MQPVCLGRSVRCTNKDSLHSSRWTAALQARLLLFTCTHVEYAGHDPDTASDKPLENQLSESAICAWLVENSSTATGRYLPVADVQ